MVTEYEVIHSWGEATQAKKEKLYLLAARLFRLCAVYYENAELGPYDPTIQSFGTTAMCKYQSCLRKLTPQERQMLDDEMEMFMTECGYQFCTYGWEEFANDEEGKVSKLEQETRFMFDESFMEHYREDSKP